MVAFPYQIGAVLLPQRCHAVRGYRLNPLTGADFAREAISLKGMMLCPETVTDLGQRNAVMAFGRHGLQVRWGGMDRRR